MDRTRGSSSLDQLRLERRFWSHALFPEQLATFALVTRCTGCGPRRCAIVRQSVGAVQVVATIGLRSQIFRKANDTITEMYLFNNKIGDGGAIALAESLKAMFVTCVLQVRASLFLWHVCAHIHRRHSGTCRETVLACYSMRFFCVDVCELLGVSRREVRPDVMHCGRVLRCL